MGVFRRFRAFEYALWQKTKIWKRRKSTENFLNQKMNIANRPTIPDKTLGTK